MALRKAARHIRENPDAGRLISVDLFDPKKKTYTTHTYDVRDLTENYFDLKSLEPLFVQKHKAGGER